MFVVFRHVAEPVETDGAADDADDQCHDDGELVHEQGVFDLDRMAVGKLETDHHAHLDQHQNNGKVPFRPDGKIDQVAGNQDFKEKYEDIDEA